MLDGADRAMDISCEGCSDSFDKGIDVLVYRFKSVHFIIMQAIFSSM